MTMTPLPGRLDPARAIVAWRVDHQRHAKSWNSGLGAELAGGRWNPKGIKVVYCSFDPSTTILEAAVHRGFQVLDTVAHVLTCLELADASRIRVVSPGDIPNPAWLQPGIPSAGQQAWGAALLAQHPFVVLPSVVSRASWNLVFRPDLASGQYALREQVRLLIDGRLNPPGPSLEP